MSVGEVEVGERSGWLSCAGCRQLVYGKRWTRNLGVCPFCQHHGRLTARARIAGLVDPGSFAEITAPEGAVDPLGFVDSMPYPQRLARARGATGEREAVVGGTATVDGHPVALAVMDFRFLGGSLGTGTGELITRVAEEALARAVPVLLVPASGGARMQEGILSLLQMAKVSQALDRLHEAGLLVVSIVTDPTYGGVAASFATQADVILAEPGARLGFAGPRVIRDTIGQELPLGFQTAEFLREHGLVDLVVDRSRLPEVVGRLLAAAGRTPRAARGHGPVGAAAPAPRPLERPVRPGTDAWAVVQRARALDRPTVRDYAGRICDWFLELHGDRLGADSATMVGGLARIGDRHVVLVGTQKGHSTREVLATNFGMAGPEGYRKAIRLFSLAEKLRLPVVTLVDTPGAYPGLDAERHGQAHTIAASILRLVGLRTPVVSVITGEGGSGGALALAVADRTFMLSNAVYSVISPEGCAAILWSAQDAPRAAAALRLTAPDLLDLGVIDGVVPEPDGGAQRDPDGTAVRLRRTIEDALAALDGVDVQEVVARRRARLRAIGAPGEAAVPPPDGTVPDGERPSVGYLVGPVAR
ncbi:acetyl-CoA carboxylase carboxyltransferase subunit alpha/beta [Micromonospora sp. NPDC049101]|uniref:acetyl-CoA carboxylase carboxyltransferase subunit alpha/beta n=1 Tax=Micromonospora sp. NPDC049101 TaxID=3155032 RepID=UPI0033ED5582